MKNDDARLLKYIWLTLACGPDSGFPFRLYSACGDIDSVYKATDYGAEDLPDELLGRLSDKRLENAFEVLKRCRALGVTLLCIDDDAYPDKLKKIYDPPLLLYCKGRKLDLKAGFCVGMVGTRKMTDYGMKTACYLAEGIAAAGAVVISGLAKGIDSACQRAALNAGGFTVGVIGNSIDSIYPKESAALFNRLYQYGAVVSEYYPGCHTNRYSFPRRNRIIAGLSDILVVVEAPAGSGALITAEYAVKQGKPVYVPPMPLTEENAGTAALLRAGARLVTSPSDLLTEYEAALPHTIPPDMPLPKLREKEEQTAEKPPVGASEKREDVYNFLLAELEANGPESLQEVVGGSGGYSVRELMQAATALELDGLITRTAGGRYDALPAETRQQHT